MGQNLEPRYQGILVLTQSQILAGRKKHPLRSFRSNVPRVSHRARKAADLPSVLLLEGFRIPNLNQAMSLLRSSIDLYMEKWLTTLFHKNYIYALCSLSGCEPSQAAKGRPKSQRPSFDGHPSAYVSPSGQFSAMIWEQRFLLREERCEGPVFFSVFVCFLLYLGLLHKGYEVCSETAGLAAHVPASRTT